MSKKYKYKCKLCHHVFDGGEEAVCPECESIRLEKILFYEMIKDNKENLK